MDSTEFFQWIAYSNIVHFDDPWQINALNCQVMAACAGNKNSKVSDFMPSYGNEKKEMSSTEMKLRLMGVHGSR